MVGNRSGFPLSLFLSLPRTCLINANYHVMSTMDVFIKTDGISFKWLARVLYMLIDWLLASELKYWPSECSTWRSEPPFVTVMLEDKRRSFMRALYLVLLYKPCLHSHKFLYFSTKKSNAKLHSVARLTIFLQFMT